MLGARWLSANVFLNEESCMFIRKSLPDISMGDDDIVLDFYLVL